VCTELLLSEQGTLLLIRMQNRSCSKIKLKNVIIITIAFMYLSYLFDVFVCAYNISLPNESFWVYLVCTCLTIIGFLAVSIR
jgi:hypothetical protein